MIVAEQARLRRQRRVRLHTMTQRMAADGLPVDRSAGGVPVLAHPVARRRGPVVGFDVIAELAAEGLAGVEVDHPDHTSDDRSALRDFAATLDLLVTGSSDYHGSNKTAYLGQETTDPQMLERIEELSTGSRIAAVAG